MSNTNGNSDHPPINLEQLREVRKAVTWGDSRRARLAAKEDGDDGGITAYAFHRAAVRLGIGAEDFETFLDQVSMDDLNAALEDETPDPTKSGKS